MNICLDWLNSLTSCWRILSQGSEGFTKQNMGGGGYEFVQGYIGEGMGMECFHFSENQSDRFVHDIEKMKN